MDVEEIAVGPQIQRPDARTNLVYDARRVLRRPTARWRALPDFLIIGAQKAGTTSLFDHLQVSPEVRAGLTKEIHFFDRDHRRGPAWYRSSFPLGPSRRDWVTGESSPYYLLHPRIPVRVHDLLPEVRLIALVRHPVDRAYSHFNHSRFYGIETETSFERALDLEESRTADAWASLEAGADHDDRVEWFSYGRRSTYAPQLRRWLDTFPPDAIAIYTTDELSADTPRVVRESLRHIGVDGDLELPRFHARNTRDYEGLDPALRDRLFDKFADDVAEVETILGRPTGW